MSDWVQMTKTLPESREVKFLSRRLGSTAKTIVAELFLFWRWVDTESADGNLPLVTESDIDSEVQHEGFAKAMTEVGWLQVDIDGARIPKFDHYLGRSAKKRALDRRRKENERHADVTHEADKSVTFVTHEADKSVTTTEQRRKDLCSVVAVSRHSTKTHSEPNSDEVIGTTTPVEVIGETATATAGKSAEAGGQGDTLSDAERQGRVAPDKRAVRHLAALVKEQGVSSDGFKTLPIILKCPLLMSIGGVDDVGFRQYVTGEAVRHPEMMRDILATTLETLTRRVSNPGGFYRSRLRGLGWAV